MYLSLYVYIYIHIYLSMYIYIYIYIVGKGKQFQDGLMALFEQTAPRNLNDTGVCKINTRSKSACYDSQTLFPQIPMLTKRTIGVDRRAT